MRRSIAAREDPGAIYLIDSSIYIFRAWHVSKPSTLVDGLPVDAALGFVEFILQLLHRRQPGLIACAFDQRSAKSARKALFPQYKANRSPLPAGLQHQFRICCDWLDAIGISWCSSPRIEADDIIGMWSQNAAQAGRSAVIVSADKDLCQFVGRHDALWDFARDTWMDYRAIENRYGVRPAQIPDWLALTGDKVDNIPGIPGIGPGTAARLLTKWGNLDTLLANIDKVPTMKFRGAAQASEQLRQYGHIAQQSRQLTGLIEDPAVPTDIATMTITPNIEAIERKLGALISETQMKGWLRLLQSLGSKNT